MNLFSPSKGKLVGCALVFGVILVVVVGMLFHAHKTLTPATRTGASSAPVLAGTPTPTGVTESQAQTIAYEFAQAWLSGDNPDQYLTPQEQQVQALHGHPVATVTNLTSQVEGVASDGSIGIWLTAQVNGQQIPAFEVFVSPAGLVEEVNG